HRIPEPLRQAKTGLADPRIPFRARKDVRRERTEWPRTAARGPGIPARSDRLVSGTSLAGVGIGGYEWRTEGASANDRGPPAATPGGPRRGIGNRPDVPGPAVARMLAVLDQPGVAAGGGHSRRPGRAMRSTWNGMSSSCETPGRLPRHSGVPPFGASGGR